MTTRSFISGPNWFEVLKTDVRARKLADNHYSRQTPGAPGFSPPGQTVVLITEDEKAVWGSHRPAPWTGLKRADGFEGHCCFIYRNEGSCSGLSSDLIGEADGLTAIKWGIAPFLTYIAVEKVRSVNPGYSYKLAGFKHVGFIKSSKHGKMAKLVMPARGVFDWGVTVLGKGAHR